MEMHFELVLDGIAVRALLERCFQADGFLAIFVALPWGFNHRQCDQLGQKALQVLTAVNRHCSVQRG